MKRFPLVICLFLLILLVTAGIPIAAATPTITGISPSTGPVNSVVTVTITGSGFTPTSNAYLYKCGKESVGGSQRKFTGTIRSVTSDTIVATFALNGVKVGDYGVIVGNPITDGPFAGLEDEGNLANIYTVYTGTGAVDTSTPTVTMTTSEPVTTATTSADGGNSVFFETDPPGAEIWLNGEDVGTSTFTYYTNQKGLFDVVVKKIGYEDYAAKVSILEGKRVHFYAPLTLLSSPNTTRVTTTTSPATSEKNTTPTATATTIRKSTLKIPTPYGTEDPPATEDSAFDPAVALWALALGTGFLVFRRR